MSPFHLGLRHSVTSPNIFSSLPGVCIIFVMPSQMGLCLVASKWCIASPEKLNAEEHGDVFFLHAPGRDLACKIRVCIVKYRNNITIKTYHKSLVPGQALYILDICPENRDESNGNSILRLWLQFIPIFGAMHSQLRKGHTKKRHPHAKQKVSFTYNPEVERQGHVLKS